MLFIQVMCFGAASLVSMVVAVVCIQLARLGLVTHLSDGDTHRQDDLDVLVVLAIGKFKNNSPMSLAPEMILSKYG